MEQPILEKEVIVSASPEEVWRAWTTVEGVRRFFAPDARLEMMPGGAYEILFDTDARPGSKGSEGCKVLSFVPGKMFSFTWNAPPQFARARRECAQWVVLLFEPVSPNETRVSLFELGWKGGKEGESVYEYFDKAWTLVLNRLAHSFSEGPINWSNPWRPQGKT